MLLNTCSLFFYTNLTDVKPNDQPGRERCKSVHCLNDAIFDEMTY